MPIPVGHNSPHRAHSTPAIHKMGAMDPCDCSPSWTTYDHHHCCHVLANPRSSTTKLALSMILIAGTVGDYSARRRRQPAAAADTPRARNEATVLPAMELVHSTFVGKGVETAEAGEATPWRHGDDDDVHDEHAVVDADEEDQSAAEEDQSNTTRQRPDEEHRMVIPVEGVDSLASAERRSTAAVVALHIHRHCR